MAHSKAPAMQLYVDAQYTSPYAMSVYVALLEKQLSFTLHEVDLSKQANHQPGFVQLSLTRRVPTLIDGDFALTESSAITEFLEESCPGPRLYPTDPKQKARARQVQAWLRSDLMPLRVERPTTVVFCAASMPALSEAARTATAKLVAASDQLLAHDGQNLFGAWSIADADLALMLNRLAAHGDALPPLLARYVKHQWARPSIQSWVGIARPSM